MRFGNTLAVFLLILTRYDTILHASTVIRYAYVLSMKYLLLVLSLCGGFCMGQQNIPTDYFTNPLEIPLILSGNFGELRSNHFHSGLDIKTQQRTGIPIYAPADAYVSRIKVAHGGYGKALYLKHPNGYSTVYAHLDKYAGVIQQYVKTNQYSKERFQIELFPKADELVVKKGDLIGYTGNTGSSGGPHLHFEIRDANSRPMNPLHFGIAIKDNKAPLVGGVFVYPLSDTARVNGSKDRIKLRLTRQQDGSYRGESLTASGTIGFGVATTDQQDGASNKNGTYKLETKVNGQNIYNVTYDRFSFDETRYLNRHIDYGYYKTNKSRIQKLFRQSNNPLSVIHDEQYNGMLQLEDGMSYDYQILLTDWAGNETRIRIPVTAKTTYGHDPSDIVGESMSLAQSDQANSYTYGPFSVYIPSGSLYQDEWLDLSRSGDTLHVHKDVVPLHKSMSISADVSNYAPADRDRLYIGRLNYNKPPIHYKTIQDNGRLSIKTRTFGDYVIAQDLISPSIKPLNFKEGQWVSKLNTLRLKIEDTHSGIASYRATINGKFILMEYDYKKDVIVYDFEDHQLEEAENNLKVVVLDNVGNSTTFEATFFRKNQ